MPQWVVPIHFLVSVLVISCITAQPMPPHSNVDSWSGWKFGKFDPSKVVDHAQNASDALNEQSKVPYKDRPHKIASLAVPGIGILNVPEVLTDAAELQLSLHPKTQLAIDQCGPQYTTTLTVPDGSCACLQALDAYYKYRPRKPIPKGTSIVIYGTETNESAKDRRPRPLCLKGNKTADCAKILEEVGIACNVQPAPRSNRWRNFMPSDRPLRVKHKFLKLEQLADRPKQTNRTNKPTQPTLIPNDSRFRPSSSRQVWSQVPINVPSDVRTVHVDITPNDPVAMAIHHNEFLPVTTEPNNQLGPAIGPNIPGVNLSPPPKRRRKMSSPEKSPAY